VRRSSMECLQLHEFKELPQAAFLMTPQPLRLGERRLECELAA